MIQLENEKSLDILEDLKKETKEKKFKLNPVGIFFVAGSISIVWKFIDILIFIIEKI